MSDAQLNWRTLWSYERAVRLFNRSAIPILQPNSFESLTAATSVSPAAHLPVLQSVVMSDGYHLACRHYDARGAGRVMILIHGAGGFGDQMQVIARHLSQQGLAEAYTLDMRGHGWSPGRRGHAVDSPRQLVTDVAEMVAYARQRHPGSRIVIAGHSAGGGLALAASQGPLRGLVAGYLFLAPFMGLGSEVNRPHFGGWVRLHSLQLRILSLISVFGITRFNGCTVLDFSQVPRRLDDRYAASWSFNTTLAFGPGLWRRGSMRIEPDVAVMLAAGWKDECFVWSLYHDVFREIAPHVDFVPLGSVGHWEMLADPVLLRAIEAWLAD